MNTGKQEIIEELYIAHIAAHGRNKSLSSWIWGTDKYLFSFKLDEPESKWKNLTGSQDKGVVFSYPVYRN